MSKENGGDNQKGKPTDRQIDRLTHRNTQVHTDIVRETDRQSDKHAASLLNYGEVRYEALSTLK